MNDAILEVQTRYPEECHYTNWNVAAADGQDFSATDNQCFSDEVEGAAVDTATGGDKLYVGRVTVPTAFFDTDGVAAVAASGSNPAVPATTEHTPRSETRRDSAGNVIVFFDPTALPLDGSHCWLFRAGRLNQWFSNRDQ